MALFDKFFRLDDARTSNTGGTGVGLSIAKDSVNLHGGKITAESQDEITIFTITLPSVSYTHLDVYKRQYQYQSCLKEII